MKNIHKYYVLTMLCYIYLNIQNEYYWLITTNNKAEKKISQEELIATLKKKYKLD